MFQKVMRRIRMAFLSRRQKLSVVRELRQIRRNMAAPGANLVWLHRRFDELMMIIFGQTNMSWLRVWEMAAKLARGRLVEIEVQERTALTALDDAIRARRSIFPPHYEWNLVVLICAERRRIQEFYDSISGDIARVRQIGARCL